MTLIDLYLDSDRQPGLYCSDSDHVFPHVLHVFEPCLHRPIVTEVPFLAPPLQILPLVDLNVRNILMSFGDVIELLVLHSMRNGFGSFYL